MLKLFETKTIHLSNNDLPVSLDEELENQKYKWFFDKEGNIEILSVVKGYKRFDLHDDDNGKFGFYGFMVIEYNIKKKEEK